MDRSGQLLTAALFRPMNLIAPGVGLLLALTAAPWWIFPISIAAYALMVVFSLRDPSFAARVTRAGDVERAGERIDWRAVGEELGRGDWLAPLNRVAASEQKLEAELASAPDDARGLVASTLREVRDVARLGLELARKLRGLDHTLASYAAMDPRRARAEAADRRRRAAQATDDQARASFLEAASALEESAASAEGLLRLRERTIAQLDSLAASVENVAVRSIKVRVSADGAAQVADALRVNVEAIKETLGVFEESDAASSRAANAKGKA